MAKSYVYVSGGNEIYGGFYRRFEGLEGTEQDELALEEFKANITRPLTGTSAFCPIGIVFACPSPYPWCHGGAECPLCIAVSPVSLLCDIKTFDFVLN